jgi:DNA-binding PadR family transcriptional regulator
MLSDRIERLGMNPFGMASDRHRGPVCGGVSGRRALRHLLAGGLMGEAGMPGLGGRGFRASRILGAGDLQLIVLALLAEKPRHGYEIMKALQEHSHGFYAPSPGMIYPALTYLEEIGHAEATAEGAKKLYRITPAGEAHLAANRVTVDAMLAELARMGARMAEAREYFSRTREEADPVPFREARRNLKRALAEKANAGPEEQQRIVEILLRAAREIRGQ